jgi:hypothetical protein
MGRKQLKKVTSDFIRGPQAFGWAEKQASGTWLVNTRCKDLLLKRIQTRKVVATKADAKARLEEHFDLVRSANTAPYEFFSEKDLRGALAAYERFTRNHKPERKPPLAEIVDLGLERYLLKQKKEFKTSLHDEVEYWVKKREGTNVEKDTQSTQASFLRRFASHFRDKSLGWFIDPNHSESAVESRPKERIVHFIEKLGGARSASYGIATKRQRAQWLRQFFDDVFKRHEIAAINPAIWAIDHFVPQPRASAPTLKVEQIRKLFSVLKNGCPQTQAMIPFFALLFYSGRRTLEIAHPRNPERRLAWANFKGFTMDSIVTGGKEFIVTARKELKNGKVIRTAKKNQDSRGDLAAAGVAWLRYYYEEILKQSLPTKGDVHFSALYYLKARKDAGLGTAKLWPTNCVRHTAATAFHAYYETHHAHFWLRCGHSRQIFEKHYQNAAMSRADAEEFLLRIRPNTV